PTICLAPCGFSPPPFAIRGARTPAGNGSVSPSVWLKVSSGGVLEIGSFQLVPVAYIPPPPPPPSPPPPRQDIVVPSPSNLEMAHAATGDGGSTPTPPSAISMETLQSRAGENSGRASFSGLFVSGAVVVAVAVVSMVWLMVVKGLGRSTRERLMSGRRDDGRKKAR
ncbi:unnamed protein product, partial [Laminaria digitata]